jgi:hypothetical protein
MEKWMMCQSTAALVAMDRMISFAAKLEISLPPSALRRGVLLSV